jgi:hypothetical protein
MAFAFWEQPFGTWRAIMKTKALSALSLLLLSAALISPAPAGTSVRDKVLSRFATGVRAHPLQRLTGLKAHRSPGHRGGARDSGLIVYDEPEAVGGTWGYGINSDGFAAGEFVGGDHHTHGFMRAPDASFTRIDVRSFPTSAFWLNDKNVVIGNYLAHGIQHAYLRTAAGKFLKFEPEDTQGTYGLHINNHGVATGDYVDSAGLWHGFIRAKDGALTTFEEPLAALGPDLGTFAGATNVHGDTIGPYFDADFIMHGYVRHDDGSFEEFDVPGAVDTIPYLINSKGWIVGFSDDENGAMHGFIRKPNGQIIPVDVEGAGTGPGQGTIVGDINKDGIATGNYVDGDGVSHGFLRQKDGTIQAPVDADGAGAGGTIPASINADGEISGFMFDTDGNAHGVIGTP